MSNINDPFSNFNKKFNELENLFGDSSVKTNSHTKKQSFFGSDIKVEEVKETKTSSNDELLYMVKMITDTTMATNPLTSILQTEKQYAQSPEIGDVIGISRGLYEHYGIYVGNNRVIHFTSTTSDVSTNNAIMETDISHFLRGDKEFFSIDFDKFNAGMKKATVVDEFFDFLGFDTSTAESITYQLFTPEETIERIKIRIGESGYHLMEKNCEHVVMWAKTGRSECNQILTKKYRHYYKF